MKKMIKIQRKRGRGHEETDHRKRNEASLHHLEGAQACLTARPLVIHRSVKSTRWANTLLVGYREQKLVQWWWEGRMV